MSDYFKGKVSKQGRRRIINVPNKNKDFQPGAEIEVRKRRVLDKVPVDSIESDNEVKK